MTIFPGDIPRDTTTLLGESFTKTINNQVAQRVTLEASGQIDPRVVSLFHTSATGEISEVIQTTTYTLAGVVDTITYTDLSNVLFIPTGTVGTQATKLSLGSQLLAVTDLAIVTLTPPAHSKTAYVQNHPGVSIKISSSGSNPTTGETGVGYLVEEKDSLDLSSLDEINDFKAIAIDATAPGEIYVEYFNL